MGLDSFGEIDYEDGDVGSRSSPLAKIAECLVTWSVDEEYSGNFDLEVKPS